MSIENIVSDIVCGVPSEQSPKPISTTLDVTEECSLRCKYCFTHTKAHKKRVLDENLAHRIIDWWIPQCVPMKNNRSIQLGFWGGEPLLELDMIKRLVKYANEKANSLGASIEFGGTTNGLAYTPEVVEWCRENKALFLVSLDGIQPAHDMYRRKPDGTGSWKEVDANLREALKIAPFQRIRTSFSAETIQYFYESVLYFVEDLGITNFAFSPVYESNWNKEALEILEEQFELATDYAIKRLKEGRPIVLKHLNDEANIYQRILNGELMPIQNPCGAGNGYTGWSIDGFMFPCHRFNKHGLSTEQREKLPTIIAKPFGESFKYVNKEWRKKFYKWKETPPQKCLDCSSWRKSTCNGGCYAVNWDLTGDLFKSHDKLCDYTEVQKKCGINYFLKAQKEGLEIPTSGWGENIKKKKSRKLNIDYNSPMMNDLKELKSISEFLQSYSYNKEMSEDERSMFNRSKEILRRIYNGCRLG